MTHDTAPSDSAPHWLEVYLAMQRSDLGPLSRYLRAEPPQIEPSIRRLLADMIDGSANSTGYRLKLVHHPDLPPAKKGREARMRKTALSWDIAKFVADAGAIDPSAFDAAITEATEKFKIGRTQVIAAWSHWMEMAEERTLALRALRSESEN